MGGYRAYPGKGKDLYYHGGVIRLIQVRGRIFIIMGGYRVYPGEGKDLYYHGGL